MKKVVLGVLVAMATAIIHAEAMYWQVNSMQIQGFSNEAWQYAQIEVLDSDGNQVNGGTYLKIAGTESDALAKGADGAWFDLGTYGAGNDPEYKFMLELVNSDFEVEAASNAMSYSGLVSQGVIVNDFDSVSPLSYKSWNAGTVDLPEPTSGLLMLLGASLLALRRRQA